MNKNKIYILISSGLFSLLTHAASMKIINDENISQYFTIDKNDIKGINPNDNFKLIKQLKLSNGLIKNKYIQYYKNVPIFNGLLTNSEISGEQRDWFGYMLTDIHDDLENVNPSITKANAISIAEKNFKIRQGSLIKNKLAQLYVRVSNQNKAKLIYMVSFNVEGSHIARPYFIIDAQNGIITDSWDGLTTKAAEGPGGNEKTGSYYYGRDYPNLEVTDNCTMSTSNVETYNMQNKEVGGSIFKFSCPVNSYKATNGAYSPLNDGHYFGMMVFAMYKDWYKLDPLGSKLKVKVHYGMNYENAHWDGQAMSFGDGGSRMYPLTALDVMAHEVSHGVTEKNSGLIYKYQSGGINEAFSDMAGETAEDYMAKQVGKENDWLVGGTIVKSGGALRYFQNPTNDGYSIDNAADYNDSMDVHFISGVYNKAFYLIANKPNWDIKKAFSVFLAANQLYWQRDATYNSAACGVAKAANDLKYEVSDIISSFKAVGVDATCPSPSPMPQPNKEIELKNGSALNNIQIKKGGEYGYFIKVPVIKTYPYDYEVLVIRLSNTKNDTSNNSELYVRYDNGTLQKINEIVRDSNESFVIKKPKAGTYHLLIKGKSSDIQSILAFYGNYSSN